MRNTFNETFYRLTKKLKNHPVEEIVSNKFVEIRVDTFVKTDTKSSTIALILLLIDTRNKEILIVEVGITSLDNLQQV